MNQFKVKKDAIGKRGTVVILLFILCLLLAPNMARARVMEDESGIYLGLTLEGSSFHSDVDSPIFNIKEDGGGAHISVGYRFNPVFMLEMAVGGSNHKTSDSAIEAGVASIQILGYYRFLPESSFRPYLKGGIAGNALTLKYGSASARLSGSGIAFGGGVRCFLSRRFSLGLDLTHNMIRYDKAKLSLGPFSYESEVDGHGRLTTFGITAGFSF